MSHRRPTVARLSFTFQYKPFMWCRLDARLRRVLFIYLPFEASLQTPDWVYYYFFGFSSGLPPTPFLPVLFLRINVPLLKLIMTHPCMHLLYLTSELSCEYFQSTHLACWFGQMLTKAISWMKSSIASLTLRGVPVSLVRPWIWSLFYIRFRYQINLSSLTSTLDEMPVWESSYPPPLFPRASSMPPHPCVITALM